MSSTDATMSTIDGAPKKHDHRKSLWLIAGGSLLWCYRCGAWRPNVPGYMYWHKPTGTNGANPAMKGDR